MTKKNLFLILLLSAAFWCNSQTSVTLPEVLDKVLQQASVVRLAENQQKQALAGFKFYRSQLKPGVRLFANLPNYSKTSSPIIQPDGTIAFTSIRQANSSVSALVQQIIPQTGGRLFLYTDLQRFDDFSMPFTQYNGIPIRLGIEQPLLGFNPWKYDKQIQPLLVSEASLGYSVERERALGRATALYFDILVAEQNLDIARSNEAVNTKLLTITEERLALGKVSEDEKLQLEIELNNARLSVSRALIQLQTAQAALAVFLGENEKTEGTKRYVIPDVQTSIEVDVEALLASSRRIRPEYVAFQRNLTQAQRDKAQARTDFGLQANIFASIGLARGSDKVEQIYNDPFDEQQFNVGVELPIVDWGRRKAAVEQATLVAESVELTFRQQILELENSIRQNGLLLMRLQNELVLFQEIMDKAEQRFEISNERYILGNIDITNLTLAQREKDQARRNYINALRTFWVTCHEIRVLTGFDVVGNRPI